LKLVRWVALLVGPAVVFVQLISLEARLLELSEYLVLLVELPELVAALALPH
jgi:hypothetical protein